jgi:hypothetical protein
MTPSAQSLVNHLESVKDAVLPEKAKTITTTAASTVRASDPLCGEPSGDVGPAQRTGQDTFAAK